MNLNNLNLNEKIEDLLAALKKKERKRKKYSPLGTGYHRRSCSSCRDRICSISLLCSGYLEDLKKISMMILMITSRMKKSKMTACRENGNRVSVA